MSNLWTCDLCPLVPQHCPAGDKGDIDPAALAEPGRGRDQQLEGAGQRAATPMPSGPETQWIKG